MRTFSMDTGHGKRSATLDVDGPTDLERLLALVRKGAVLVQGYRRSTLARYVLSPERLAAQHLDIVYVSVNSHGHKGPWAQRPGWDQLGAVATGLATCQGSPERSQLLPGVAALDYTTGYLACVWGDDGSRASSQRGPQLGDARVAVDGDVDAAATRGAATAGASAARRPAAGVRRGFGRLRYLRPVARMSLAPPAWTLSAVPLWMHAVEWLPLMAAAQPGRRQAAPAPL